MAEVLRFDKNEEWYAAQAAYWSARGDDYKSLLYARRAAACGTRTGKLRLAKSLYESGNFHKANEIYLELYIAGVRTAEVYVGIVKNLSAMSRHRSALFFLKEGRDNGALPDWGNGLESKNDYVRALSEMKKAYPDEVPDKEFAKLLFLFYMGDLSDSDTMLHDVCVVGDDIVGADIFFTATSFPTPEKINEEFASKLLSACDKNMKKEPFPRADLLSAKVICLVRLGRLEEANDAADELAALDLPDDNVALLKCANALIALGDYDGALDYLEELFAETFNENLVLQAAIANLNIGENARAKQLFSDILTINPENYVARYWCARLTDNGRYSADSRHKIPEEEDARMRDAVETLFDEARGSAGKVAENDMLRARLLYTLECDDEEYAGYVARNLARLGVYTDVAKRYLISPNGRMTVKREIIVELLMRDFHTAIPLFVYGMRTGKAEFDPADVGCSRELTRAYAGALATLWIYVPEEVGKLDALFTQTHPLLRSVRFVTERDTESLSAALLLLSNLEYVSDVKDATSLFVSADDRLVVAYCEKIEAAYPEFHRPERMDRRLWGDFDES